ncbi:MAG: insulinase family protein [Phycisphaeraceae bacterium]|nr:insulinase family protein [Phycisphaeraceae bacterium]
MNTQFHHQQLDNGLTVLCEANPSAHTAAVGFFVRTGARDEQPPLMGVSHFLEHMMFKATAAGRTAADVNRQFDQIGADFNAFTSHEQTLYHAHVLPEMLPQAVDLFTDMLRPALREDDFEMERKVILEEISMYDDRPGWRLQDAILESYFRGHPLGHRVLGTAATVGSMTAAQMRDYFNQRYSPDNLVVAAAGRVDFDALLADLAQRTAHWQPTGAARDHGNPPAAQHDSTLTDPRVHRHYLAAMWPGPAAQDSQRYAARVLADVLGDSEGSRLYWALIDPGLADEADLSYLPYDGVGAFFSYASCAPEKGEQVEQVLRETLRVVCEDLSLEEIVRAKNKLATSATLMGERPQGRMTNLGANWLYLGRHVSLEQELERLMAVTLDEVRELLAAAPPEPCAVVRLTPKG